MIIFSVNKYLDIIFETDHSHISWWYGSGWDEIYFQHQMEAGSQLLPYSCCKKPNRPCTGTVGDTYRNGCRKEIVFKWYSFIGTMYILVILFQVTSVLALIILVIHIIGVRDGVNDSFC